MLLVFSHPRDLSAFWA